MEIEQQGERERESPSKKYKVLCDKDFSLLNSDVTGQVLSCFNRDRQLLCAFKRLF